MPTDADLVGREFPATTPHQVTTETVRAFAEATRWPGESVPPTYPIVAAFDVMAAFFAGAGLDLSRIVHGDEAFAYERPIAVGDELLATLQVDRVRPVRDNEFYTTTTRIADLDGNLVCTATATFVHRGGAA